MGEEKQFPPAREPMLRFNHTGYGIEYTKIIQLLVVLGGFVWFLGIANERIDALENKLAVAPKEVLSEVRTLQSSVMEQLAEIRKTAETARIERGAEIRELEQRAAASEADRSQLNAQVGALNKIMEDIHAIVKSQYGAPRKMNGAYR